MRLLRQKLSCSLCFFYQRHHQLKIMSGNSSNLINKMDSKAHQSISDFVNKGGKAFTLDGQRGEQVAKLCRHTNTGQMECTDIAMEAKDLFATMQSLNFFCTLPQDPKRTDIVCEKIPQ